MLVPLLIQFVKPADLFGWRTSHYSQATGIWIWIWNPSYSLRNKDILQVDLKRKNSKSSYALLLLLLLLLLLVVVVVVVVVEYNLK